MAIGKAVNLPDVAGRGNGSCPSPRSRTIIRSPFVSSCTDLVFDVMSVVVCDDLSELMEQRFVQLGGWRRQPIRHCDFRLKSSFP